MRQICRYIGMVLCCMAAVQVAGAAVVSKKAAPEPKPKTVSQWHIHSAAVGKYLVADYAFRDNNPRVAAEYFIQALENNPGQPMLVQNVFKLLLFSGQLDDAAQYAKQYLEYDPQSISATMLLAVKAIHDGQYGEVQQRLAVLPYEKDKNLLAGVDILIVPYFNIWAEAGLGRYEQALKLATATDKSQIMSGPFGHYQKALLNDLAGNAAEAQKEYELCLTTKRSPYHFIKAAGSFYERHQMPEKAKLLYEGYQQRYPQMNYFTKELARMAQGRLPEPAVRNPADGLVEVIMEAVRLLYRGDVYKEALAYLQMILYLRPDDVEAKILLASFYEEYQQYEDANVLYDLITPDSDFYWAAKTNMAENLYRLGEKKEARKKLLALADEDATQYSPLLILGDLLRKDGEFDEASNIYTKIIKRIGAISTEHWPIFFARGICYERAGDWKSAEKDLLKALELYPDQPEVLNYLGYSWIDRNEHIDEAKQMVEAAVKARPEDAQIIDSMGWVLFKLKEYQSASVYLERALELLPDDVIINDHLGDTYWQLGRKVEARFQWNRVLKFGPSPLSADAIQKKIREGI